MTRLRGAFVGAALAVVAAVGLHFPLAGAAVALLSLFLALTACVYLGALLAQRQTAAVVLSELAVGAVVFLCAIFGTLGSVLWLAAGYALHGLGPAHLRGGRLPAGEGGAPPLVRQGPRRADLEPRAVNNALYLPLISRVTHPSRRSVP